MSNITEYIKSDIEFYELLYRRYKTDPKLARSTELAKTMREVIAGLKKLQRMH